MANQFTDPYFSEHTGPTIDDAVNKAKGVQAAIQAAVAPLATKTELAQTNTNVQNLGTQKANKTELEKEKARAEAAEKANADEIATLGQKLFDKTQTYNFTEPYQKIKLAEYLPEGITVTTSMRVAFFAADSTTEIARTNVNEPLTLPANAFYVRSLADFGEVEIKMQAEIGNIKRNIESLGKIINEVILATEGLENIVDENENITIKDIYGKREVSAKFTFLPKQRTTITIFPNLQAKSNRCAISEIIEVVPGGKIKYNCPEGYLWDVVSSNSKVAPVDVVDPGWLIGKTEYICPNSYAIVISRLESDADMTQQDADVLSAVNISYEVGELVDRVPALKPDVDDLKKRAFSGMLWDYSGVTHSCHYMLDPTHVSKGRIQSQSLAEVDIAARLGFKIYEVNTLKLADGYLAHHGNNYTTFLNNSMLDNNTGDFANGIDVSAFTIAEVKERFRYNSRNAFAKFSTPPTEMSEMMARLMKNNITPLVRVEQSNDISGVRPIVKKYFGDRYIAYSGNTKEDFGILCDWTMIDDLSALKERIDSYQGTPFILGVSNFGHWESLVASEYKGSPVAESELVSYFDSLSESQQFELIEKQIEFFSGLAEYVHTRGGLIAWPGVYGSEQEDQLMMMSGYNINTCGHQVDDFESGNLCNLSADISYDDFAITNGIIADGNMIVSAGGTIAPNTTFGTPFLSKGALHIRFRGTIEIMMYVDNGYRYNKIVSNGSRDMFFSSYFLNSEPTFSIRTITDTTIYSINYKASRC